MKIEESSLSFFSTEPDSCFWDFHLEFIFKNKFFEVDVTVESPHY